MQACVLTFPARTGTGVQTITGVVDHTGALFAGTVFIFQSGYATLNALTAPNYNTVKGVHWDGFGGSASGTADLSTFGFKNVDGADFQKYCIGDYEATVFFGGTIKRKAYVSAIRPGEFDVTYDQNDRTGDSIMVTILGGADLSIHIPTTTPFGSTFVPTTGIPQGALWVGSRYPPLTTPNAFTGGGAGDYGWATRDGNQGASCSDPVSQAGNHRYQRTDFANILSDGTGASKVGVWASNGFTMDVANQVGNGGGPASVICFSGSTIITAAGIITQPSGAGVQIISTGINPRWFKIMSDGAPASNSVLTDQAELAIGWATPLAQAGFWNGESGTDPSVLGARFLSNTSVLRFGVPNSTSTTFTAAAQVASINSATGEVALNWTQSDGVARQILWFALGEQLVPVPPPPTLHGCYVNLPLG